MSNSFTRCQLLSQSEIAPALRSAANALWSVSHKGIPMPCQTPVFGVRNATCNSVLKHHIPDKLHLLQLQLLTMDPMEVADCLVCCLSLLQYAEDNDAQPDHAFVHGIFTGLVALGHLEVDGLTASTHLHITRFLGFMRSIRERDYDLPYNFTWDAMDVSFVDAGLRRAYRAATENVEVSHASLTAWTDLMAVTTANDPESIITAWKHVYVLRVKRQPFPQSRHAQLRAVETWWLNQEIAAAIYALLDLLSCTSEQVVRRALHRVNGVLPMNERPKLDQSFLVSLQEAIHSIKKLVPWRQRSSVIHNLVDFPATDPVPHLQSFVDAELLECSEKMVADLQNFSPGSATLALSVALFALFNWYWRNGYHYVQLVAFLVQSVKIRQKIHRLPADISVLLSPVAIPHLDSGHTVEGVCQRDRQVLSQILNVFGSLGNVGSTTYITSEEQRRSLYDPFKGDMAAFASLESSLKLLPARVPATEARIELAKTVLRTCDSLVDLRVLPLTEEATKVCRIRLKLASATSGAIQRASTGRQQVAGSARLRALSEQYNTARKSLFSVQMGLIAPLYDTFNRKLSSGMDFEISVADTIKKRASLKTVAKRPTTQEIRPVPPAPVIPRVDLETAAEPQPSIVRMIQPSGRCRIPHTTLTAVKSNPSIGCLELLTCTGS
ncbi:MAG: hypothetical protein KVP17_001820 [Porospora cf. gigantea B]|uniref:uncharacterized protein n=2 Tax=Porospora cf. gigantea B TaxID=2853592 RepID=UPI003571EE05|nr:MAG: hypothetical protein KVP17_001820 [Porospora cf. gigantea B]